MKLFKFVERIGRYVVLIQTRDIQDGAITEELIAPGAVTTDKIANGAVTRDKLGDGAVEDLNALFAELESLISSFDQTGTMTLEEKEKLAALPTRTELDDTLDDLDERIDEIVAGNATLSLSASPASIFANTDTSVTVTATASKTASSIVIKKNGSEFQSAENVQSASKSETLNLPGGTTITYSAEATILGVRKTASNRTVKAYDKIYYGVGTENTHSGLSADNAVKTSAAGTYNFSFNSESENKYLYILVPTTMSAINLSNVKLDSGFGYNLVLLASDEDYKGDGVLYRVYRSVGFNNANVKLIIS